MGRAIEEYVPVVKEDGLVTNKAVDFSGAPSVALPAATTIAGTTVSGTSTITSTSANALTVGRQGATDPVLKIDASTSSVATGISVKGAAAAGGVAVAAISSGTNESLTVDAKGSGTITLGSVSTGNVVLSRAMTGVSASVTGAVTSRSGTAVAAAASVTPAFLTSSTALLGLYFGTGSPNTALTAAKGSLYMRTDGSTTNDRAYVNTDGSTAWTNITTAG